MSAVIETLTQSEIYLSGTGSAATSEVLSREQVISSVASSPRASLKIRLQVPSPNRALIGTVVKLFALRNLRAGWDSYGAQPIRQEIIERTAQWIPSILQASTPEPAVVPQAEGGLQLEWHRKGIDLEIYMDSPGNIHFSAEDRTSGEADEVALAGNEDLLRKWVARISD